MSTPKGKALARFIEKRTSHETGFIKKEVPNKEKEYIGKVFNKTHTEHRRKAEGLKSSSALSKYK